VQCVYDQNDQCWLEHSQCICEELHACEQRVRLEDDDYAYVAAQAEAEGRRRGWNEALDEAQQAIRNREDGEYFPWVQVEIALAAINSLRGEA